ncbi:MAG TPA: zinc-binding dehydrogenase [Actinomycetota bacterium]|nr:zinc-binding dehydrogenase [Actinomycetota bacterium]
MRAAVLWAFDDLRIQELELDPPRAGEVVLRMGASGVCRSDHHSVSGIHPHVMPIVLGHEGSAVVEAVGEAVVNVAPGEHVVCSWLPYCGTCRRCAAGKPALCERQEAFDAGSLADGTTRFHTADGTRISHNVPSSFAERSVVPANTVFPVDAALPMEQVALLGCAVMTGVGAVLNTAEVRPGDSVVVIGCGGVGLSAIQGARIAGAGTIVAVDVLPAKLELAKELGATETVLSGRDEIPDGFDVAIECLGRPETIEQATRAIAPGGKAVLVGMAHPEARPGIDALSMTVQEKTVTGSWYGSVVPPRDFPMLAELLRRGELRLEPLIARTIALDGIHEALARFGTGEETRSVIVYG